MVDARIFFPVKICVYTSNFTLVSLKHVLSTPKSLLYFNTMSFGACTTYQLFV